MTSTNDIFAKNDRAISAWNDNEIVLINDTFDDNGAAVASVRQNSMLLVSNSIIVGDEVGLDADNSSSAAGDFNLMKNDMDYTGAAGGGAQDILGQDPEFVDAENDDYRLRGTSPAIDAGALPSPPMMTSMAMTVPSMATWTVMPSPISGLTSTCRKASICRGSLRLLHQACIDDAAIELVNAHVPLHGR